MNFTFKLTGDKWFRLYLAFILFYFIPITIMQVLSKKLESNPENITTGLIVIFLFITIVLVGLLLTIPLIKTIYQNTFFNEKQFSFTGTTSSYLWLNIKGFFLTIITIGIYYPWFLTSLTSYFFGNSTYNSTAFVFNGKAKNLFKIILVYLVLPMVLYLIILLTQFKQIINNPYFAIVNQLLVMMILIPYIVKMYNWIIDFSFKSYKVKWDLPIAQTAGTLVRELLLTIITAGIYVPVALAKIYHLFMEQTYLSENDICVFRFKVKFDYVKVWKTIWIQILLTIITLGIYGAWSYCNVSRIFIDATSLNKCDSSTTI